MTDREDVWLAILNERMRQGQIWEGQHDWGKGDCSSPDVPDIVKAAVLSEESGEVARAVLKGDYANLRDELVQVAAVAVAWLEGM